MARDNLRQRGRQYYLHLVIPRALRRFFQSKSGKPMAALWEPLGPNLDIAEPRAARRVADYKDVFARLKAGESMTPEQIKAAVEPSSADVAKRALAKLYEHWYRHSEEYPATPEQFVPHPDTTDEKMLRRILQEFRAQRAPLGETVSQALEAWLAEKASDKATEQRPQTIAGHRDRAKAFTDYCKADLPLAEVDRAKASDFLSSLKCSNRTRNNYAQTLRAVFQSARLRGRFTGDNPFDKQRRKAAKNNKERYTDDQAKMLIEAWPREVRPAKHSPGTAVGWATLISAYSGLGLEEVCQLTVADVRTEGTNGGSVDVFDIHNGDDGHHLKNDDTRPRLVPVAKALVDAGLLKYRDALPQDGLLFPGLTRRTSKGNKIGARVGELFNKKRRALGITRDGNGLDFHSWRHVIGTKLRAAGVAECDINSILGHAQATQSTQTYAKPDLHLLKSAIDKIAY
jgi:integrase